MAQLPPPPPLPAPAALPNVVELNNSLKKKKINYSDEVYQLSVILDESGNNTVIYVKNYLIKPVLQEGPKCGLVALSMACRYFGNPQPVDDLLNMAISLGFTIQGEMFSTENLGMLTQLMNDHICTDILTGGLNSHLNCILHRLNSGGIMLVPYDADFNHSPCCKKGHKAHWAVVTGFLICHSPKIEKIEEEKSSSFTLCCCHENNINSFALPPVSPVYQQIPKKNSSYNIAHNNAGTILNVGESVHLEKSDGDLNETAEVFVFARQGKSTHLALWSFADLAESNNNLMSLAPERDGGGFYVPPEGIQGGLMGKALLLY